MADSPFIDPEMQEIFESFLIETQELIDSLSQDLMTLEHQADDLDLINRVFRSFHTIKGTSSFMGFSHITEITHHAEDILNKLRKNELTVNQSIIDVLLEVQDWIQLLVNKVQEGDSSGVDYHDTISRIELLKNNEQIPAENASEIQDGQNQQQESAIIKNNTSAVDQVLGNTDIFSKPGDFTDDELALIQDAFGELNKSFLSDMDKNQNKSTNEEMKQNVISDADTKPNDVIEKVEPVATLVEVEHKVEAKSAKQLLSDQQRTHDAQAQSGAPKVKSSSDTIRIDVDRVETLMDLSGELVLGRNRLAQLTETIEQFITDKDKLRDLEEATSQIDFITSEIQSAVMRMRMVQIGKLYQKAPRIVRDLSKEFSKKINLVVTGEETEIDRGIIEELNDPLVHMIRNSCDHGVEDPETRRKKGKTEEGTITLDAYQEGNNIVLKISDDGAGLDPEKLKSKAIERSVITQEQANLMSSREAFQLIFAPGFSTAVKVSAVSGRGVGMDVVRTNIQKLKGLIDIESEIGVGTSFIIKLPLTLAIIQGLLVKVTNETYAIPLSSVIEVVALEEADVYTINQQEVIRIRTEVLPILRLDIALKSKHITQSLNDRYVVNVGYGAQRVGLVVDELLGQQEIVIKSLGEYLGNIQGISGSTILGDGRVIMIIDIAQLILGIYNSSDYNKYPKNA